MASLEQPLGRSVFCGRCNKDIVFTSGDAAVYHANKHGEVLYFTEDADGLHHFIGSDRPGSANNPRLITGLQASRLDRAPMNSRITSDEILDYDALPDGRWLNDMRGAIDEVRGLA